MTQSIKSLKTKISKKSIKSRQSRRSQEQMIKETPEERKSFGAISVDSKEPPIEEIKKHEDKPEEALVNKESNQSFVNSEVSSNSNIASGKIKNLSYFR